MWREGDEPIRNYRLEEFLGRGQFGEVWRSTAPGGASAALKFIDLSLMQGLKEFRGIQRVKEITHPNLMPVTAIWLLDEKGEMLDDDQLEIYQSLATSGDTESAASMDRERWWPKWLVVAMLLGEKSLLDRLNQFVIKDEPGIPVDELLDYMDEAAKGIDYLNAAQHDLGHGPASIQHCDIKPANLMLRGGSVVICDFGLAQMLDDAQIAATSVGLVGTAAYMPPERIEQYKSSSASDQYSFAISYYEMRTGELPFDGTTLPEVLEAHRKGNLNLSLVPKAEQKVIRRATKLDPAKRYKSTREMVQALRRAVRGSRTTAIDEDFDEAAQPLNRKRAMAVALMCAALAMVGSLVYFGIVYPWPFGGEPIVNDPDPPTHVERQICTISVSPSDAILKVNGEIAETIDDGVYEFNLTDDEGVTIEASHDSGAYETINETVSRKDWEANRFRFDAALELKPHTLKLVLPDGAKSWPATVGVWVDGEPVSINRGNVEIRLDHHSQYRILVEDSKRAFKQFEQSMSFDDLQKMKWSLPLAYSGQFYFDRAIKSFQDDDVEGAIEDCKFAIDADPHFQKPDCAFVRAEHKSAVKQMIARGGNLISRDERGQVLVCLDAPRNVLTAGVILPIEDPVQSIAVSPNGRWLVTGDKAGAVVVWDLQAKPGAELDPGKAVRLSKKHQGACLQVAMTNRWIISAGDNSDVWFWPLPDGNPPQESIHPIEGTHDPNFADAQIYRLVLNEVKNGDPTRVVSVCDQGMIVAWTLAGDPAGSRTMVRDIEVFKPHHVAMFRDDRWLAITREGETNWLAVYNVDDPAQQYFLDAAEIPKHAIAKSSDGQWVATGSQEREALLWRLSEFDQRGMPNKFETQLLSHELGAIASVAFCPDGNWLVTGISGQKTAAIWNLTGGKTKNPLLISDHDQGVTAVATTNKHVFTATREGAIYVWNWDELKLLQVTLDKLGLSSSSPNT